MHGKALTIWGRANSVNVQKVLWCLAELDLAYDRIDAGMAFGKNDQPEYLAINPNGRVPTLVDGDYVLWESNSIMRYLNLAYGEGSPIYPQAPQARAAVDRWLDWTLSTLQPVDRPVFWALVRTPVEKRDMVAIQKDVDAEAVVWRDSGGAARQPPLHRGRSVHHRRHRARRLCAALVRRRGRDKANPAQSRALVRGDFKASRICKISLGADDLKLARARGRTNADADGAADLHAGFGTLELDETGSIRRA